MWRQVFSILPPHYFVYIDIKNILVEMISLRNFLFLLALALLGVVACGDAQKSVGKGKGRSEIDSTMFVIAAVPTIESLPLYLASEKGWLSEKDSKILFTSYKAQMDCDTAVLGQSAHLATTDMFRVEYYTSRGQNLYYASRTQGSWAFVVNSKSRIKKIDDLDKKMVGVSRFSNSDYLCAQALKKGGKKYDWVYRPQINDFCLRGDMMHSQDFPAAVLPEPYLTKALQRGHVILYKDSTDLMLGCLVVNPKILSDAKKQAQLKQVFRIYNQAVDSLNQRGLSVCKDVLHKCYGLDAKTIEKIKLPHFEKAKMVTESERAKARTFLQSRGIVLSSRNPLNSKVSSCLP
jgi:NitT/TauT family transport system substrate-binding protein